MQEGPDMTTRQAVQQFLDGSSYAVAGASTDRSKFGNQVYRALVRSGRTTFPLNPRSAEVEGDQAYAHIADLPEIPECLAVITPPAITRQIVGEAIEAGIKHLWIQPGAQHPDASAAARDAGLTVVDDGTCLLIVIAYER